MKERCSSNYGSLQSCKFVNFSNRRKIKYINMNDEDMDIRDEINMIEYE